MSAAEETTFRTEGVRGHSQPEATTNSSGTSQQGVPVAQQPSAVDPDTAFVKAEVVDHGTSIDTEVRDYHPQPMFHNPSADTPALNQLRQNVSFVALDRMDLTNSSFTMMDTVPTASGTAGKTLGAQILSQEAVALRVAVGDPCTRSLQFET